MSKSYTDTDGHTCDAIRYERGNMAALGVANWLRLAASPTFAIMALLMGVMGNGQSDLLCSATHEASPLTGMVTMYVLMSAFHLAPWLTLISGQPSRRTTG